MAADNAIHGWWLDGEPVTDWRGHDLAASAVSVTHDARRRRRWRRGTLTPKSVTTAVDSTRRPRGHGMLRSPSE